jgi:hypothetical protein
MMRRSLMSFAALSLAATGLFAASPADAAWRVIKWDVTGICQVYDFGLDGRPIPSNYRVLTGPLPSFAAAVRVKERLWHRGRCTI